MTSAQIRQKYLKFFADRGHAVIPSALLVPENDPTTLFTSSGMQPLVPYLLGQKHPAGKRLVNSQKSFRAQDIEEVGDNRHTTFFEMLGNWSLGDPAAPDGVGEAGYFKKEQLPWIFEFLTKKIGLDPKRLYITVFEGNKSVPKDTESIEIWKKIFKSVGIDARESSSAEASTDKGRIFTYPAKKNWWSRSGEPDNMPPKEPGGPDSEVFFDFGDNFRTHENSIYQNEQCHPNCDCGRFMEIANSVFMQYQKQPGGSLKELAQKNVDFGGGLERLVAASNDEPDMFKSDLFFPIIQTIEKVSGTSYEDEKNKKAFRIIADHLKAATFLIYDGVTPSNKKQGYILRRLIRRALVKLRSLEERVNEGDVVSVCESVLNLPTYAQYFIDGNKREHIKTEVGAEAYKFSLKIEKGLKLLQQADIINEQLVFDLYQSYGFPIEITLEMLKEKGSKVDKKKLDIAIEHHRELSRTASVGMFKGGLADHSEHVTKLHTATHLLHAALRHVLGTHVSQKGSNITAERLRFDFTHPSKLTDDEREKIEAWVNEQIQKNHPVSVATSTLEKAKAGGALAFFGERYGDRVTVYSIGDAKTGIVSKEVCGGPHVSQTGSLGMFRLGKEESVGAGVRRLYATLS